MLKFAWLCKNLCLGKVSWSKKDFCFQKTFLFIENLIDQLKFFCRKLSCLWKTSTTGRFPELWKVYKDKFIKENLLSWLQKKIIGLIVLKTSASVETIKAYILSLKQKLAFFVLKKINIIISRRFKHKYGVFNAWQEQRFIHTQSNL